MNPSCLSLLSIFRLRARRSSPHANAAVATSAGAGASLPVLLHCHARDALYARQSLAQQLEGAGHRVALRHAGPGSAYCAVVAVASRELLASRECAAELAEVARSALGATAAVVAVLPAAGSGGGRGAADAARMKKEARRLLSDSCPAGTNATVLRRDDPNFWPKLRRVLPQPSVGAAEDSQILGKNKSGDFGGCYSGRSLAEAANSGDVRRAATLLRSGAVTSSDYEDDLWTYVRGGGSDSSSSSASPNNHHLHLGNGGGGGGVGQGTNMRNDSSVAR